MAPPDLAVVVLTFNEERHIARALESVSAIAAQLIVVDSFSTDTTVEIARRHGAVVLQHPFESQARQFQWALDHAPIETAWVMRLDADEVVEPALASEIARELPRLPAEVAGVNLRRKHIFMGRWIRHGGRYPLVLLRIWRRGCARVEQRWMDEHIVLERGRAVAFRGDFEDRNLGDLSHFTAKHNAYATREAVEVICARHGLAGAGDMAALSASSPQAGLKRRLKERIYNRLPLWLAPTLYFFYRYVLQLGFLDGREGLIYHGLQGCWYRFLVAAKVVELERAVAGEATRAGKLAALARATGLKLDPAP